MGAFALVVALLGGSSRPDAVQIAVLRPLAALFLIPALWYLPSGAMREIRLPAILLGTLAAWMILQLIPLPPALWQALPGREIVADIDALLGEQDRWRPLSLVPSRTVNALASLVVPVAALLLVAAYRMRGASILLLIAAVGVLDALLGLGQVVTGRGSPLYFYEVTNRGSPVGVLANENHSAVLSAITLIVIARIGAGAAAEGARKWVRLAAVPAYLVVLLAVLVSGSRAGLALAGLALITTGLILWTSARADESRRSRSKRGATTGLNPRVVLWAFGAAIALTAAAFFVLERTPAFEDILARNAFEDLRAGIWPTLQEMMSVFWILGAGFGAFEEVYHIFEPSALLLPSYVNQAHNDWAQLVIEGGLPALVLLLILLGWAFSSIRRFIFASGASVSVGLFWMAVIAILAAASIVDYPLRTPVYQVLAVWLVVLLAQDREAIR